MALPQKFAHPYDFDPKFRRPVAYFCMEYAVDQAFKIYSGGLGFLAGSHMRSAYDLKQNVVGIGIWWKYGYYDQIRKEDQSMDVLFQEKQYSFLEDTGILFDITVNNAPVKVRAYFLRPEVFGTIPMFFLTTDIPENDYLAKRISHRLYDSDVPTKIAQYILLGIGGGKLLDILKHDTEVYHLNEGHGLPIAFHLYQKHGSAEEVKKRLVFTTHTPEEAGNEKHERSFLDQMSYFNGIPHEVVDNLTGQPSNTFNLSLGALRMSRYANAVSKMHEKVARQMWGKYDNICPLTGITNAQNHRFWRDRALARALEQRDDAAIRKRKIRLKENLFRLVADQTGKLFNPKALTIVWARRFAAYKRADLITADRARFDRIMKNKDRPVQIIWAGKPYPTDYSAVSIFNNLVHLAREYPNAAVMVGYELRLSRYLKDGSDVWLNNPRVTREASGTSGMTAAMNGSINFSTNDGWIPEFARPGTNTFIIPTPDLTAPLHEQDRHDGKQLLDILEEQIIPMYYDQPDQWVEMMRNSMNDVLPYFSSDRMATQYYDDLYRE